jgi:nicotinamidase-related amidase
MQGPNIRHTEIKRMNKTALLIIDTQLGMFDPRFPVAGGETLLATIAGLISKARAAQVPVIFIQHDAKDPNDPLHPDQEGWVIHPAIQPLPGEAVIRKQHPDAFQDTRLKAELDRLEVGHLVVAGIQTEYCVDTTCRRAYSLGYQVKLVQDAHSTWDSGELKADQIIAHHNKVLGGWFVSLIAASDTTFG